MVGIANSALSGHASLRSVEVPGSVDTLGAHSFDGCSSLASVRFPASLESTGGEMPWFPGPFEDSGLSSAKLAPGSTRVAPAPSGAATGSPPWRSPTPSPPWTPLAPWWTP